MSKNKIETYEDTILVFHKHLLLALREKVKSIGGRYVRGRVEINPRLVNNIVETKYDLIIIF